MAWAMRRAWIRSSRQVHSASTWCSGVSSVTPSQASAAASIPMSEAAVPEMRRSPVAGLCWKTRPAASEVGYSPLYQSDRKDRWS